MFINSINSCNAALDILGRGINNIESQTTNFSKMVNKVEDDTSINALIESIESEYNAKLIAPSESSHQVSGLNNVIVSRGTLEKMNNNSAFSEKIMKIINECCSISAQQGIRSLSPPAKSAGVIIYPDGSYLCWIESIYSELEGKRNVPQNNGFVFKNTQALKNYITQEEILKEFFNLGMAGNFNDVNRKRSK